MDSFDFSIDDFDWSKPASSEPVGSPPPQTVAPEETPPPAPAPAPLPKPAEPAGRGGSYDIPQELLPKAYREYKGDQYKRKRPGARALDFSIDDLDYGGGETAAPAASGDDWAVTRGAKEAYSGGVDSITTMADMQRIASMSTEAEQRAAMIELGKKVGAGPSRLQEPNIEGIGGVGEFFTWLGESAGQMLGSMGAAAVVGGGTGAVAGAGVGGAAGSLAGGAGALPGAAAGALAGGGYGTMAAFGAMGIGGMYNDLLSDEGVQEGLANGSISPNQILAAAVGGGAIIGALDVVPVTKLFNKVTGEVSQELVKKSVKEFAKAGLKEGLISAGQEGLTEAGQGAISELGQAMIGGNTDAFERAMSVINQGLAGAVGGFGPGAAGGVVTHARKPGEANPVVPAGAGSPPPDDTTPNNPAGGLGNPPIPPRQPARTPGENYGKTDTETLPAEGVQVVGDGAIPSDIAAANGSGVEEGEGIPDEYDEEEEGEFAAPAPAAIIKPATPGVAPAAAAPALVEDEALNAALAGVSPQAQNLQQPKTPVVPANQNAPVLPGAPTQAAVAEGEPAADLQTPLPAGPSPQKKRAIEWQQAKIAQMNEQGAFPLEGEYTQEQATPVPDLNVFADEAPTPLAEDVATLPEEDSGFVDPTKELRDRYAQRMANAGVPANAIEDILRDWDDQQVRRASEYDAEMEAARQPAPVSGPPAKQPTQKRPPKASKARMVRITNFAKGINRLVEAADQALGQLELNPSPDEFDAEEEITTYKGKKAPTKRQAKKREKEAAEHKLATERHQKALQNYVDVVAGGRTALEDAVRKYGQLQGEEQQHFVQQLERSVLEKLRAVADAYPEMGPPTPPVWGKRPRQSKRKGKPLPAKQPEKPAPRGASIIVKPGPEEVAGVKTSARDRAIAGMLSHFGAKDRPARLAKLFTPNEIAALEKAGLAEKGSMTKAEFGRWYQSVKGAVVPEGIAPKGRPEISGKKQYNFPTLRAEYAESEAKATMSFEAWKKKRKEAESAPFERKVPEMRVGRAAVQIGEAKQETAAVQAGEKGMRVAGGRAAVPVVAASARRQPETEEIPHKRRYTGKQHKEAVENQLEQEILQELPKALKAAGVSGTLSETQIEEAAETAAKLQVQRILKKKLAPLQAAREFIGIALEKAVAAYKKGDEEAIARFAASQEVLDARNNLWRAEDKAKAATKSRTSKEGVKASVAMAKEQAQATRKLAWKEREKEAEDQDPILIEIANLWDAIIPNRQKPEYKDLNAALRRQIDNLQLQRIANQIAFEKYEAAMEEAYEHQKRLEEGTLQADLREWEGMGISGQEIEEYQFDKKLGEQQHERRKRAPLSTAAFNDALATHPLPEQKETNRRIKDDRTFLTDMEAWAKAFVATAKENMKKAKVDLNEKLSSRWNTPEENVLIFIDQILQDRKEAEDRIARTGRRFSKKVELQRGSTLHDAWAAMTLVKPIDKSLTPAQQRYKRYENEQLLLGTLLDAGKTASVANDEFGVKAAKEAARENEQARFLGKGIGGKEHILDTQLGSGMIEALRELGVRPLYAPENDDIPLPLGKDPVTMTASQAMDKYMRGWRKRGKLTGWQNLMRRALMKSLKAMVGHVPVHFVDASVIASFSEGKQRPGMFRRTKDGKMAILLQHGLVDRPGLLDETLLHEMTHAATAYAIDNNIRGTRDAIRALMKGVSKTISDDGTLTKNQKYAFENEHEFLTQAMNNAEVQEMLMSLVVPANVRATIRAIGRGRAMPTYWDMMVAAVEHAIGAVTGNRAGTSYLDQILRVYPHVALSSREQQADAAIRLKGKDIKDLNLGAPFSLSGMLSSAAAMTSSSLDRTTRWQRRLNKFTPTNTIVRRMTDNVFGGDFDNLANKISDEITTLPRRIEEEMREGDQIDDEIRRWMMADEFGRRDTIAEFHDLAQNSSIDNIDMRKTLKENTWIRNDADHPLKGGKVRKTPTFKHLRDSGKRRLHAGYKARWDNLPDEIKPLLSKRLDHMKKQMDGYQTANVESIVDRIFDKPGKILPPGMSRSDAVREIMDGKMSDELKTAMGDHAKTVEAMGKFSNKGQMYSPVFRAGQHFISGRRNIKPPTPQHGDVLLDDVALSGQGIFRFIFNDVRDAVDYVNKMGSTGEERVLKFQRKYIDPLTGKFVPADEDVQDPNDPSIYHKAQPVYYVTMQDRFMAMSDSLDDLKAMREDLLTNRGSEYEYIAEPALMENQRVVSDTMPLQLQTMINNIGNEAGVDAADKALAIDMITNHYIRTQQGNRITKHMVRREGVHGFASGADEMFRSYHSNNEMMSRAKVALSRQPHIAELKKKMKEFRDALRTRQPSDLIKLPMKVRALINRGYGKRDNNIVATFGEDVEELYSRLEATMTPSAKVPFEQALRTYQSLTTLKYLGQPIYFAVQSISLPISTFPNMAAEFSKRDGVLKGTALAVRYMGKGLADLGISSIIMRSLREAAAEGTHLAKGFAPHKNFLDASGRPLRRAYDYMEHLYKRLEDTGTQNLEVKKRALKLAYDRGAIGQAGLDQPNLRVDLQQRGLANKSMRAIEESTRVFRALQEGIETINRAAPLMSYVDYYLDKGETPEQAIELAVSNMVKEQTSYSKTNWAPWLAHPYFGSAFMFKKYAAQMGYAYYESLVRSFDSSDKAAQRAAWVHIGTMSLVLFALGGFAGNPLWEPIRYLMYFLNGTNWDDAKTQAEAWMGDKTHPWIAETAMYGPLRMLGIDISNRVALDSLLFYRQPEDMSKDSWYSVIGQMATGAMGSMTFDAIGQVTGLFSGDKADQSWSKWASQMPMPALASNIFKTYDQMAHGPSTSTGISTGEPIGLLGGLATMLGVKTRSQARPFEQGSAAQNRHQEIVDSQKSALIRRINSGGGLNRANMRALNDWNRAHPDKNDRINSKALQNARRRRRDLERDIAKQNAEAM